MDYLQNSCFCKVGLLLCPFLTAIFIRAVSELDCWIFQADRQSQIIMKQSIDFPIHFDDLLQNKNAKIACQRDGTWYIDTLR